MARMRRNLLGVRIEEPPELNSVGVATEKVD
jgi:hypothetical protein